MPDETAAINACRALFLADIQELGRNALKLVVAEGQPVGSPETIEVGGVEIPNCTRVEPTDDTAVFELTWEQYVGYAVINESFASFSEEEQFEGRRYRIYSKSRFLDYMSRASFACDEYPGPTRHYCVACEDHIVDVLSVVPPIVQRLR